MATKFLSTLSGTAFGAAGDEAVSVRVSGDSVPRVRIDAGGKITWGSGSATGDVTLYRSAANALKTDDTLQAVAGVITATTDGAPSAALADGAIAIDTTNDAFYFRSSSTWSQVSGGGGASLSVSDGPPDSPSAGDLWFESDTGRTLVYYADGSSNQWVEIGLASASGASGTDGKIQFSESDSLTSDTLLHWDNTNNRLGVGTASPTHALHVDGTVKIEGASSSLISNNTGSGREVLQVRSKSATTDGAGFNMYGDGDSSHASKTFFYNDSSTPTMTMLPSGNVGIGTSGPGSLLHVEGAGGSFPMIQLHSTNSDRAYINITNSTTSSGYDNGLLFGVASTEEVLIWNRENTHITFAVNNTEKMRLQAGGGISFNGDTSSSNALDDYEEGTWSPTYTSTNGDMSGVTVNATFTEGQYQKVGRWVTCTWFIRTDSITTLGTGFALLSGFPFDKSNRGTYTRVAGTAGVIFDFVTRSPEFVWFPDNGSSCYMSYHSGDQNEYGTLTPSNLATSINRNGFFGTITYETDD